MFVCECFSFFFSEVYGLYLNKTVGWEQSILRWCVFVCACACNSMFVRASSDDESEDVQAFTEAFFFFFYINVPVRITVSHVFMTVEISSRGYTLNDICNNLLFYCDGRVSVYVCVTCICAFFFFFARVYTLYAFTLTCSSRCVFAPE